MKPIDTNERLDRRVARTRRALRQALLDLINEKRFDDITVEEITARADVSRATFYLHYKDKEDLLLAEINELVEERVEVLARLPLAAWRVDPDEPHLAPATALVEVFMHIQRHANLYRLVLRGEGAPRLTARVGEIIALGVYGLLTRRFESGEENIRLSVPVEFLASYFSGALLGCVSWWLDSGLERSAEEMTRDFQRMFFPGAREVLKVNE
jgi:AcrR family transcriptional regulator